jgi:hypothetical protein
VEGLSKVVPSSLQYFFGVIFILVLLSLFCSFIAEVVSSVFDLRSSTLARAIESLLGKKLATAFYLHPYIRGLSRADGPGYWKPSYVPPQVFSLVLLDIVSPEGATDTTTIASARASFIQLQDIELRKLLLLFVENCDGDIRKLRSEIEFWFNYTMGRASLSYRMMMRKNLFVLGLVFSFTLNADVIMMAKTLSISDTLRSAISQTLQASSTGAGDQNQRLAAAITLELENVSILGWSAKPESWNAWPYSVSLQTLKILGLLISAVTVAFLAPIFFDLASKFVVLRYAERGNNA